MDWDAVLYELQVLGLMTLHVAVYVVVAMVLWRRYRSTREFSTRDRVVIGCIFGFLSVLSTHFGVNYGTLVLNVRDVGPMTAGLFFDPVSGVIAGLIGGFERYIVGTYFDIGAFTTTACSISTCFAGFFAAFLNMYLFKGKKPSIAYAFFMGCVIEVFHMYAVFATHKEDMSMAFAVVKVAALPMIIFSGIALGIISILIMISNGEWRNPFRRPEGEMVTVSHRFQVWLFGVTAAVLVISFLFNYSNQTQIAIQNAKYKIDIAEEDIANNYHTIREKDLDPSQLVLHIGDSGMFAIVDASGIIVAGTVDDWGDTEDKVVKMAITNKAGQYFYGELYYMKFLCKVKNVDDGGRLLTMISETDMFEARDAQAYQTFLADILLFTVIYVLISLLVQSLVVDNLIRVNKSLNRITEGDLEEKVNVYNSSEFASLSDDINLTVDALKGYIEAAEKRMEQELLLAKTIQASALPTNFDFGHRAFELFATMDPAKEVGGDFYDFFFVDSDRLALVIADVSGKGIPAALFMMRSKTAIRGLTENGVSPGEVLRRVNDQLCNSNDASMFVTVWIGIIDLVTGDMCCANAGHEYPAVKRGDGKFELFRDRHGLPLGAMEGMKYKEYDMHLDPGDTLYVYTDGVPEAINADEEQYDAERMLKALSRNRKAPMKKLLPAVKRDMDRFVGEADQFDDITMLGFHYNGMESAEEGVYPDA